MREWFQHFTFTTFLRMICGKRYTDSEAHRCKRAMKEFFFLTGLFLVADAIPWLGCLDLGGHVKKMKETAKELDDILSEWLEEHKKKRHASGEGEGEKDFMGVMLSLLADAEIEGFDADTMNKATTLTLFAGSIDTNSVILIWALSLLLNNPNALRKALEELETHVGRERVVEESDIDNLVYLQATVKETLRLYPPGPLSGPREFREDCIIAGYHVKKNTRLIMNLWKIHRDPTMWPDPLEFKPERFLTTHKHVDVRGRNFEFLPFGSGRRICPGISLALRTVHFALASVLHSFEVATPLGERVDMTESFGLTNKKVTDLKVIVKSRLPAKIYESYM